MVKTQVVTQGQGCCQGGRPTKSKGLVHDTKEINICHVGIVVRV